MLNSGSIKEHQLCWEQSPGEMGCLNNRLCHRAVRVSAGSLGAGVPQEVGKMGWLLLAHVSSWRTSDLGWETHGLTGVTPALWEGTADVQESLTTSQQGSGNNL